MTIITDGVPLCGEEYTRLVIGRRVLRVPATAATKITVGDTISVTPCDARSARLLDEDAPTMTEFTEFAARMGVRVKPPKPARVREAVQRPATKAVRPTNLATMVGHDELRLRLTVHVNGARKLGQPAGHVLLHGPAGVGKTSLALLVASLAGGELVVASGDSVKTPETLVHELCELHDGDVFFVDEIHGLPERVKRTLLTAMEDGRVEVAGGSGAQSEVQSKRLKHFILVGATTDPGKLSRPMLDRFELVGALDYYDVDELTEIILGFAVEQGFVIEKDAAVNVAGRSRGTARLALNHVKAIRNFAAEADSPDVAIQSHHVDFALRLKGVDGRGLEKPDRRVLWNLCKVYKGGPVGVDRLASGVDTSNRSLESITGFLRRALYMVSTGTGQVATDRGFEAVGLEAPVSAPVADDLEFDDDPAI
jgi:Holliday junction DNA helicase RuvB